MTSTVGIHQEGSKTTRRKTTRREQEYKEEDNKKGARGKYKTQMYINSFKFYRTDTSLIKIINW